jgi:hypothetical protein
MAALFGRRSDSTLRGVILGTLACAVVAPVLLMLWVRTPVHLGQFYPVEQPVRFDHRLHVSRNGIGCLYCHGTAETSSSAGMPSTGVCMGCHVQVLRYVALLEPVRLSHETGRPIVWRRVHDLPDFVYFDHAIHVSQGVGCVACHGRVDLMQRVVQVAPLTMEWCLGCHRARERDGVTRLTTCTACHR